MDPALEAALEPVLHDLSLSSIPFEIRDEDWVGEEWTLSTFIYSNGSGTGIYVSAGDPWPEQVASLAEQVQEHVIEEVWNAWPECPHHPGGHPLTAVAQNGRPLWRCPKTEQVVAVIGQLG